MSSSAAATCAIASYVGIALGEQMRHGGGLESYYGGGFEIFFNEGRKIVPVPGITFLFIDVSRKGDVEIDMAFEPMLKIGYMNDVLIVRKLSLTQFGSESGSFNETYIFSPIYRKITNDEVEEIKRMEMSFESQFTGVYLYFGDTTKDQKVAFLMHHSPTSKPAAQFSERETEIEMQLSDTLMEKIRIKAAAIYGVSP